MISGRGHVGYRLMCAVVLISLLLAAGCTTATSPAGPAEPAQAEKESTKPVAVEPTKTREPTPTPDLPPPPDLDPGEGWQPYPQEAQPTVGDAELVPGYEPMRRGVAAMNDEVRKALLEAGLRVNTARTVVLPEKAHLGAAQDLDWTADTRLASILVWNDTYCMFRQDCQPPRYLMRRTESSLLEKTSGDSDFFEALGRVPGERGTAAEGLYGYQYWMDPAALHGGYCFNSFTVDFGPVTPLDYDQDGTPDLGVFHFLGDKSSRSAAVERKENTLTFRYDPPICSLFYFMLASPYPPRDVEAQIQDVQGVMYPIKAVAPDHAQEQAFEETVSIAPVAAAEDPDALDPAKLEELFKTEGVVLGMLVLETNAPDSLIPSGSYLERAYVDGDKGVVELIDVTSGKAVYRVDLLAERVEDPGLSVPSARIFLGSKTCLTCLWGWSICRDCFFWEAAMSLESCLARLGSCAP